MPVRALKAIESLRGGPVWLGAAAAAALFVAYAVAMAIAGEPLNRLNVVVILLLAFLFAVARFDLRADRRDLATLQPLTRLNEREFRELLSGFSGFKLRPLLIISGACALLGVLVVPASQSDPLATFEAGGRSARLYWSFGANALLFGFLGFGVYASTLSSRVVSKVAAAIEGIDLLDLSPLAPFSRIGLRQAFGWLGGSTIASLIILDVEVLWPVVAIIAGTLALSTRAFLAPVRAIHLRIRQAKHAELRRVREAVGKARTATLERSEPGAAAELEGLLAWEARIDGVPEWPFDVPTLVRFGALVLIAVGSWLGGALVERALGAVLAG